MQTEQFQLHATYEERHWWFVARRQIVRRLVAAVLPPGKDSLILDVGCGTGANIADLASAYPCIGIDTSAKAIELARGRFPGVQFQVGVAPEDVGPAMQQVRLVTLMDVMEHVPDDFLLLSKLVAASSPGTHFLVTVPADDALWGSHDESFGHYRRYDLARLEMVWTGLPVTPRLVSYFNTRLYWLIRAIRWRNQRRGTSAGADKSDIWLPVAPVNAAIRSIFAGESKRLLRLLEGRTTTAYPRGASLVAILRREEGAATERTKPSGLPPDRR